MNIDVWVDPTDFVAPPFAAHFTDPIYSNPSNEFAPFGTDEGADALATWAQRRDELTATTTLRDIFLRDQDDCWDDAVAEVNGDLGFEDTVDGSVLLVSLSFTLLRLTGRIDAEGQELGLAALDRLVAYYGVERQELQIQRRDLERWVNPSV